MTERSDIWSHIRLQLHLIWIFFYFQCLESGAGWKYCTWAATGLMFVQWPITYPPVSDPTMKKKVTFSVFSGILHAILEFVISWSTIKSCWWCHCELIFYPMKRFLLCSRLFHLMTSTQFFRFWTWSEKWFQWNKLTLLLHRIQVFSLYFKVEPNQQMNKRNLKPGLMEYGRE